MKDKQFMKDMLAYVRYIHNHKKMNKKEKYAAIVSTIGHDFNGLINEDRFFTPRVTGYSRLEVVLGND
jgi:hypothetical protein